MNDFRRKDSTLFPVTALLLMLALLLGGGQGTLGDTLVQLAAIALLAVLYLRQPDFRQWPKASWLVLLPFIPAIVFLLPWPETWSTAGKARGLLAETLKPVIGDWGWQGSLIPTATERAAYWLLPAGALFLAGLRCSLAERKKLAAVLLAGLVINAVIGLAQKADGLDSLLYFYSNTNRGHSVGMFANANHYAIAMAAGLPLVWAGLTWLFNLRLERHVSPLGFPALGGMAVLFILGFMLSGSRAGLALGMLGCLLMLPAVIAADRRQGAKHWMFALMAVGLFLSVQVGLYFIILNFEDNPLLDGRWQLNAFSAATASAHAPMGASPGSYWFAFPHYGGLFTGAYVANHAHNEYLELWLESRWLAVLAGVPLLLAFIWQGGRLWFRSAGYSVNSVLLARAAWVGLLLLLVHSSVDYPLRTTAVSAMAGLLAALLVIPKSEYVNPE